MRACASVCVDVKEGVGKGGREGCDGGDNYHAILVGTQPQNHPQHGLRVTAAIIADSGRVQALLLNRQQ